MDFLCSKMPKISLRRAVETKYKIYRFKCIPGLEVYTYRFQSYAFAIANLIIRLFDFSVNQRARAPNSPGSATRQYESISDGLTATFGR